MTLANPALSDLAAAAYHRDAMRATETGRLLARAGAGTRRHPVLDAVRHGAGAALIGLGAWTRGQRRAPRPVAGLPPVPAPTAPPLG